MMRLTAYVLACALIFSALDWTTIYYTRFIRPDLKEAMHASEHVYAAAVYPVETIICPPAMALKPLMGWVLIKLGTTETQEKAITHAPAPSWSGFYYLFDRAAGWTFIPWWLWVLYWSIVSGVWWLFARRFFNAY